MASTSVRSAKGPTRYQYIDCIRGIAVIGVISVHLASLFPNLPYHVRAPANLGANGVQMFFVVSALTLMLSWQARRGIDHAPVLAFYIRRLFRIAPMFWLGLVVYAALDPLWRQFWQEGHLSLASIILTFFFLHAWRPDTINAVVPGGWTIGVEMTFYVVFPFVASILTNARRAVICLVAMLLAAPLLNQLYLWANPGETTHIAIEFLNYWLPNQLPSFALGFVAYYAIVAVPQVRGLPAVLLLAALGVALFTAFHGISYVADLRDPISRGTMVALATLLLAIALAQRPFRILVNPVMRHIGKVSFSAYLLHFLVVESVHLAIGRPMTTGLPAIFLFALLLIGVVAVTVAISTVTYRFIEAPMIAVGNQLLARRRMSVLRA